MRHPHPPRGDQVAPFHCQEHAFALQADLASGRTVLEAAEFTSGRFDWPDVDARIGDLGPSPADRQGTFVRQVRLPTPATFPGMPADRLWAFEDARVAWARDGYDIAGRVAAIPVLPPTVWERRAVSFMSAPPERSARPRA